MDAADPMILVPGQRSVGVGRWMDTQNNQILHHTITGWHGVSGSGIYAQDSQGRVRLVALFQRGIFEEPNTDKNGAVVIPSDVLRRLDEAGNTAP
ncbi:MAG: hypothetical protein M1821_002467 [Bathelium mastoideum]|nr:MAG: hypothetical protein M1821_002467 [Bathelium mastoideum]